MAGAEERAQALVRLDRLQTEAFSSFSRLIRTDGQARFADFENYLMRGREYAAATIAYEQAWPGSFDVQTVVTPLVQQLSIFADFREAAGDRAGAKALREEADRLAAVYLSGEAAAGVRRTRAMEDAAAGRFHDALLGLDEAYGAFVTAGREVDAAQTLVQLANIYEWLNDYERSLGTLEAANALVAEKLGGGPPTSRSVASAIGKQFLSILQSGTDREGENALGLRRIYFEVLQGRARINRKLGNYDAAREQFEEARPFVQEFARAGIDFHLAAIALDTGNLSLAGQLLTAAAPDFDHGLIRPRRGALRLLQADLAQAQARFEDALALSADGLADQDHYPDLDLSWKLHWRQARALRALDRFDESLAAFRLAAKAADTLRMAPLGYALDTTFVRDKLPMMEEAIDHALTCGDGETATWFIEMIKSRALSAILSQPIGRSADTGGDADKSTFDELSLRIDAIAFAAFSGSATTDQLRERDELIQRRRQCLERIRIRDPRWRGMTQPHDVDVAAISSRLESSRRVALVLYIRGRRVISTLLGAETLLVGERVCTDATFAALQDYVENLHQLQPDWFLADISAELGLSLPDLLCAEILEALSRAETVLVVPHGILHLLPWAAMRLDGRRLLETAAVGVLPNLAALTQMDRVYTKQPSASLFGDPDYTGLQRFLPLPQAGPELTDLEQIYGAGLLIPTRRGPEATEAALLELLGHPGAVDAVLHVACHADLDVEEPLLSGLILTASKLDAAELIGKRCGYLEVVLSACSTGWRPQTALGLQLSGDDALGLVASFLESGARSLLVSLTQAEDETARQFSVSWHRYRRAGKTPLEAYRKTQLDMLGADPDNVWKWAGITAYSCR